MLVSSHNSSLVLVTQADHAVLAGDLAKVWGNEEFERFEPNESMVTAVRLHDVGWIAPDAGPLFNAELKRPTHVTEVDLAAHRRFFADGVETVMREDAYAGLVVSLHWTGLYRGRWGLAPAFDISRVRAAGLDEVIRQQESTWIDLKQQLLAQQADSRRSVFEQRLWMNYDWLQALDLVSIFLCTNLGRAETIVPSVPAGLGQGSLEVRVETTDDSTARFTPYPFEVDEVTVSVPGRRIPDRPYPDQRDLRDAVEAAEEVTISWKLVR